MCLPLIIFDPIPGSDTSVFYSAMIREIAAGNWDHGFYPLIPPLFPVIGAVFAKLGFSPFVAAKIASSLCFAAGVFPLYYLCRLIWYRKTAVWSCALYVLCSRLVRYGGAGILDPAKTSLMLVIIYGLLRFRRYGDWRSTLYVFASSAGLSLVRGEGIAVAVILIGGFVIVELVGNRSRTSRFRWVPAKSLVGALLLLLLLAPWLTYMWCQTGYPVTDLRQLRVADAVYARLGIEATGHRDKMLVDDYRLFLDNYLQGNPGAADKRSTNYDLWNNIIVEIVKGLIPFYLIFAVAAIIVRICKRRWRPIETAVAAVVVGHTTLLVCLLGGDWLQKRYVIHAMPFLLGWTAYGMRLVLALGRRFSIGRRIIAIRIAIVGFSLVMIWDATLPARPSLKAQKQEEKAAILDTASWLRREGVAMVPKDQRPLSSTATCYHTGRQPVIVSLNNTSIALLGDCDLAGAGRFGMRTFDLQMVRALCELKHVNFLIADSSLVHTIPDFADLDNLPEGFRVVYRRWESSRRGNVVIGVERNLKNP